jgi:ubiquitin fusion degradation protein 1
MPLGGCRRRFVSATRAADKRATSSSPAVGAVALPRTKPGFVQATSSSGLCALCGASEKAVCGAMWNGGGGGGGGGGYDDEGYGAGGPGGVAAPTGAFTRQFRAFPVSFIDRADLERGDKIVLPPSALDTLARLNISYPMLFQLESRDGMKTHCGVLEFVAEEGHVNVPYWLMQNLAVPEGGLITIRNASLPKGTYVKFQPQTSDFLDITNPKAVLEATLRGFTCLTKGDAIAIVYNDKTYHIDVLEVAPGDAISIIEADVNVEFAAPPDYVEPTPAAAPSPATGTARRDGGDRAPPVDAADRLRKRLARLKKPRFGASSDDDDGEDGEDAGGGARGGRQVGRDSDDSDSEEDRTPAGPVFPGSGQTLKAGRSGSSGLTFGGASGSGSSAPDGADGQKKTDDEDGARARAARAAKFEAFSGAGRTLR